MTTNSDRLPGIPDPSPPPAEVGHQHDFYPGHESLPCDKQACLVHLIRDLNDDLLGSPFDEEFKALVAEFGGLLRHIKALVVEFGSTWCS
jgi:hypothetical protein